MSQSFIVQSLKTDTEGYLEAKDSLVRTLILGFQNGVPPEDLAEIVSPAFEYGTVIRYLSSVKLRDLAQMALSQFSLDAAFDVELTGIDPSCEAVIRMTADRDVWGSHYRNLPRNVIGALRTESISLAPSKTGSYQQYSEDHVVRYLFEGEPLRLI